jgi:hypothetical protein
MKALKYQTTIQDDLVHSYTRRTIREVWVPSCKMCFNEEKFAFPSEEPRVQESECEEIFIPPYWSDVLTKFQHKKSQIDGFCDEIFLTNNE